MQVPPLTMETAELPVAAWAAVEPATRGASAAATTAVTPITEPAPITCHFFMSNPPGRRADLVSALVWALRRWARDAHRRARPETHTSRGGHPFTETMRDRSCGDRAGTRLSGGMKGDDGESTAISDGGVAPARKLSACSLGL